MGAHNNTVIDGMWRDMGLTDEEYELIVERLGREPNYTELSMLAVLWSEHCGYKHSKNLLKRLPVTGTHILVGPGENAGVVDIGGGLAVAFKIESHNHPCAIEPYEGAATGVGGIVRDILAMGARPVALASSVRFGPLSDKRALFLFSEALSGIAAYSNTLNVPTIASDIVFDEPYVHNPLCNVLCAGVLRHEDLHKGFATGEGNVVMVVGHSTGRDGIHGCTFASEELGGGYEELLDMQVGDPHMGKLLIEACLEMMAKGAVIGIQDMGAAGITSSGAEMAFRAGTGMAIDVSNVPVREKAMAPYEIMLSESQERMLLTVSPDKVDIVKKIGTKWGVNVAEIGQVNSSGNLQVYQKGVLVAAVPVKLLNEAPIYCPDWKQPDYFERVEGFPINSIPIPALDSHRYNQILITLLASQNIASRHVKLSCFDSFKDPQVVDGLGEGAGLIKLKGTTKGLAISTYCNGRLVYLNPEVGTQWAVAQTARFVASVGAVPLAISNCLNFGSPEKPEIFWQLKEAVEGMAEACKMLDIPVTGGNVSLYNETYGEPVYPTPVIGMVGLVDDIDKHVTVGFKVAGHSVGLLGKIYGDNESLAGSEYLKVLHDTVAGAVKPTDLVLEKGILKVLSEGAHQELFASSQNISSGGFAVALACSCIKGENGAKGVEITLGSLSEIVEPDHRPDAVLFGESNPAVIVSFDPEHEVSIKELCEAQNVPFSVIGKVVHDNFTIKVCGICTESTIIDLSCEELEYVWINGIQEQIEN